ncbi:glycosyltransferase family 4 protein [Halosimplex salinum]|uniref:glycosyltransferase family 4 protein n=1 Tax=Halosimplex salinum TaxID=1710538 RepID=UPI000F485EE5|nr:glycosyltransferase family 4 protein [Halosimplex salinum]
MNSFAIIRIPSQSQDRDPSAKAIENIISVSKEYFENIITFEDRFKEQSTETVDVERRTSENILFNVFLLLIYQARLSYALYERKNQLGMVFLHAGGFLFVLPIITCKLLGIPVTVSVIGEPHKGYENISSGHLLDKIITEAVLIAERFAYYAADGIVVFSMDMLSYKPLKGYQSKCVRVRFNFETVVEDTPAPPERDIEIVYLGRVCELKGADRAAEAVRLLSANTETEVTASFLGDGNLLEELRDEYGNDMSFSGWVQQEAVEDHLRESKIIMLPSRSEGLPKALLEAMSAGVVPITTPVGNIPSVIEDGENGLLVNDPTADQLADAANQLLASDALAMLSQNAQETIRSEFGFESAKNDFESLLKECGI